ncbi:MAG TPA: chromate resistance protein ChrB domain-containing protein [Burkholderiales bacterium]|jgi:hypothetical protein|nr:chromate resistance protein ChrB domain-containing protein [Burkholderiales bacterium]
MNELTALVLSLPTHNSTVRMRVWRALKESGCGVLRDGVYVLPAGSGNGVLGEIESDIRSAGGFAMTLELKPRTAEQLSDLRKLFDRSADYGALLQKIDAAAGGLPRLGARKGGTQLRRLRGVFDRISKIDFFPGQARLQAAEAIDSLERRFQEAYSGGEPRSSKRRLRGLDPARYQKRLWATRKDLWVDRLASAWLIKRFIDRNAKFVWIARPSERPRKAIGFDYNGAQFTHAHNLVTFEVLRGSFGLDRDPALMAIGSAVHFLDVGGIPAPDATGLETLLKGIKQKARNDDELLAEAMRILDFFHSAYTDRASGGGAGRLPASQTRSARPSSALAPASTPVKERV